MSYLDFANNMLKLQGKINTLKLDLKQAQEEFVIQEGLLKRQILNEGNAELLNINWRRLNRELEENGHL